MSRALRAALLLSVLGAAAPQDTAGLVAQLDGLPETFGADEFLRRPAMMELAARVDAAGPALREAAVSSPSPSVRASALYLLAANGLLDGADDARRFLDDPHPLVRAVAAQAQSSEAARAQLTTGPAAAIAARLSLRIQDGALDWLPESFARRRFDRGLDLLREGTPFAEAPAWPVPSHADFGRETAVAYRILSREVQFSIRSHDWARPLLDRIVTETDDRSGRLGVLVTLGAHLLTHREPDGAERGACPHRAEILDTLTGVAERWLWKTPEPYALDALLVLLADEVRMGYEPARTLLDRAAAEHPSPDVREHAALQQKELKAWVKTEEYLRAWKQLHRQLDPANPQRPPRLRTAGSSPPTAPTHAPLPPATEAVSSALRWTLSIVLLGAAVIAVLISRRRAG